MKGSTILAIFAFSALFLSIFGTSFAFADDDSSDDDKESSKKVEKENELKKEQKDLQREKIEKENKLKKEQQRDKIEQSKQTAKELREEYQKQLEEKKKILLDYQKELKAKYDDLKNEFKQKYAQLRISSISDTNEEDDTDGIESEIKHQELRLLKYEFRENIKNLKLEAKQHFDELKNQLKTQETDRKNKIHDRINELKEKYKNKIREHDHLIPSDLDGYPADYESKKIEICHVPQENSANSHTLSISLNAVRAHLEHGDYIGVCDYDQVNNEEETDEDETDEGQTIHVELKEELGISQQ